MVIFDDTIIISCNNIGQTYISNYYSVIAAYLSNGVSDFLRTIGNLVITRVLQTVLNANFR